MCMERRDRRTEAPEQFSDTPEGNEEFAVHLQQDHGVPKHLTDAMRRSHFELLHIDHHVRRSHEMAMHELEIRYQAPGDQKRIRKFKATTKEKLDAQVAKWADSLDEDVKVDWPTGYEPAAKEDEVTVDEPVDETVEDETTESGTPAEDEVPSGPTEDGEVPTEPRETTFIVPISKTVWEQEGYGKDDSLVAEFGEAKERQKGRGVQYTFELTVEEAAKLGGIMLRGKRDAKIEGERVFKQIGRPVPEVTTPSE